MAGAIVRGDIRLVSFPPPDKTRPVVVLTRNAVIASLGSVTVAPVSSSIRSLDSEVILDERDGMKSRCAVKLHSTTTLPKGMLGMRIAQLSPAKMAQICSALNFALGCDV